MRLKRERERDGLRERKRERERWIERERERKRERDGLREREREKIWTEFGKEGFFEYLNVVCRVMIEEWHVLV